MIILPFRGFFMGVGREVERNKGRIVIKQCGILEVREDCSLR